MDVLRRLPSRRRFDRFKETEVSKRLPVTSVKTDDRERCIYPAQPLKLELFLKVKVRRPSAQAVA